jgi:hypothetical protein
MHVGELCGVEAGSWEALRMQFLDHSTNTAMLPNGV